MADIVYQTCTKCGITKTVDNFYKYNKSLCKPCIISRYAGEFTCLECGVTVWLNSPSNKARKGEYRCHDCAVAYGIKKAFEDPEKHEAWRERTRVNAHSMRAAVKNPYTLPKGEDSFRWKGGKPKCEICGELCATYEATLCKKCWRENTPKGEDNPNWIGGKRECIDCGRPLKKQKTQRCGDCYAIWGRGENHHNWKDGASIINYGERRSVEANRWRKAVLRRDDYLCRLCREESESLHAHHRFRWSEYKELRYDIDNGVTLCPDCHFYLVHEGCWNNIPLDFWL